MNLVVAVTGASGAALTRRTLHWLERIASGAVPTDPPISPGSLAIHVVCSPHAATVWKSELGEDLEPTLARLPHVRVWSRTDFSAPFASGSNAPDAVVVVPCSMATLARVAHGGGDDLLARTCDVALKERRRLILVARETPLSLVHLRNMVAATEAGAIVLPAVPAFYAFREGGLGVAPTIDGLLDSIVSRVLDLLHLRTPILPRWGTPVEGPES